MLLLAVMLPAAAGAQFDLLGQTELMLMGGGMTYLGDLNDQSVFGEANWAGSAGLRVRIDNRWAVRGALSYGTVSAMHDWIEQRNLSFRSHLTEASLTAEFTFRPYGAGGTESWWTPYLFGGLAVYHFNPMALYGESDGSQRWVALQPLHTEGQGTSEYPSRRPYKLIQLSMPFGLGVMVRLNKDFSLSAEYGFRKTWSDYLDDVSTTYVGASLLEAQVADGVLAAAMADRSEVPNAVGIKRGDDSLKDWYSYFNVAIGVNMEALFGWMRKNRCEIK